MSEREVVTINVGSSSVRCAGYLMGNDGPVLRAHHRTSVRDAARLARIVEASGVAEPAAFVHRIVLGGPRLTTPCRIDREVKAEIARLGVLAPLHNPGALAWVDACERAFPNAAQLAVFDSAFFADLPEVATTYALPHGLCREHGIRRHGFHGLAHEAMWRAWCSASARGGEGRLVSFQLGSGCSAAAIAAGVPVDTTMGMTPLEGLVMATRSGDVDPGVLLYLQRSAGFSVGDLDKLLQHDSGLRGISGTSGDVHRLEVEGTAAADLALDVYCHRARKHLGALLAVLGGADAIAFAGGVGEHEPQIRARIAAGAAFCGLRLDHDANRRATGGATQRISTDDSAIEAWVVALDEEALLIDKARSLLEVRA